MKQRSNKKWSKWYLVPAAALLIGLISAFSIGIMTSQDVMADPDPGRQQLKIGGVWIIQNGVWLGDQADPYIYEDPAGHFRVQKSANSSDDAEVMETDVIVYDSCGGIESQDMIINICPGKEEESTYSIGKINAEDLIDGADTDPVGYSIYNHDVGIEIMNSSDPDILYNTWKLAGGIRLGGQSRLQLQDIQLTIGTEEAPAPVGFANMLAGYYGSEANTADGYGLCLRGLGTITVYANTILKDVSCLCVECDKEFVATSTTGTAIQRDADKFRNDSITRIYTGYNASMTMDYDALGNAVFYNKRLDKEKAGYDVLENEVNNIVEDLAEAGDHEHYSFSNTGSHIEFVANDPSLSSFSWLVENLRDGGGFEILDGTGYTLGGYDSDFPTYCLEQGSTLKIRVLPKYGHQFDVSMFKDSEGNLISTEPQTDVAVYEITIPINNDHLDELYQEVPNEVDAEEAGGIGGGGFELDEEEDTDNINGNLEMVVEDADVDPAAYEEKLEDGYEVGAIVDLAVHPQVKKGDTEDVWAGDDITEFDHDMEIFLALDGDLAEDVTEDTLVQIVRDHEGEKTVLDGTIMNVEGQLGVYFKSNQFSTYALAFNEADKKTYTVDSEAGDSVTFEAAEGHDWMFVSEDITNPTEEFLEENEIPAEAWNDLMTMLNEQVEAKGNHYLSLRMLALYDLLYDVNGDVIYNERETGPFTVKIKVSDELKALIKEKNYNTFAFVNIDMDDEGNLVLGDQVAATLDGDYLVATFKHFSTWALVGKYVEPQTTASTEASTATTAASTSDATTTTAASNSDDNGQKTSPKTGDSAPVAVVLVFAIFAMAGLLYNRLSWKR